MDKNARDLLDSAVLQKGFAQFGLDPGSARPCEACENFVYDCDGKIIARFTHSSHRTLEQVLSELDFVSYLSCNGVPCSRPVCGTDGRLGYRIDAGNSYFAVSAFEKAKGVPPSRENTTKEIISRLGQVIGMTHRLAKSYVPSSGIEKRPHLFEDEYYLNPEKYFLEGDTEMLQAFRKNMDRCRLIEASTDNFGLVHTDFHQGNFFVEGGEITVFDFDDSAYFYFADDLAMPLFYHMSGVSENRVQIATEFFASLFDGYKKENGLGVDQLGLMGDFFALRETLLFGLIGRFVDLQNMSPDKKVKLMERRSAILSGRPFLDIDFRQFA